MALEIHIDATGLRQLEREVSRLKAGIRRAIAQGVNEAGDRTRTQVQRALWTQTGVTRYSSITSRVRTARASEATLTYTIVAKGRPATRPKEFPFRVKRGPGGGVTVWLWGVAHTFPRSFQIAGFSGAAGLRMREGADRKPIRGFDGPNIAKEAVKGQSARAFYTSAETYLAATVVKRIGALLARI